MKPGWKSDLLHIHLNTKFKITYPNRAKTIQPIRGQHSNARDLVVSVSASQLPLVFPEWPTVLRKTPELRGFQDLRHSALIPEHLGSWLSPPPPPNPVQNSTFCARSVSPGKGKWGKDGQALASIMRKEIYSKNENASRRSPQTHSFRPGCRDSDMAFRQAARECFSPPRSFTQQTPAEVLPLTRLRIKCWDPEVKMCQPGPRRRPWAKGLVEEMYNQI